MANNIISTYSNLSYDKHQEVNAKVLGVLKYNNEIRENLLRRNIGSYGDVNSNKSIGYISDAYSLESSKPHSLGEEGLLGYTHIFQSDYQTNIQERYGLGGIISYYRTGSPMVKGNRKWKGLYEDYTKYIDETFGLKYTSLNLLSDLFQSDTLDKVMISGNREKSLTVQSILNDFLQYDNIKYAMEQTRIGTVNPNPLGALAGSITTNINNFSGTDTPLGIITNQLYAHALRNGAQFNSIRRTPYITPGVYDSIGNKLSTISTLDANFRIDPETGRLAYEFGSGEGTRSYEGLSLDQFGEMDMIDGTKDIANSNNARYRNLINNEDLFMPFKGRNYSQFLISSTPLLTTLVTPVPRNRVFYTWNEGDRGNWIDGVFYYLDNSGYGDIKNNKLSGTDLLSKTHELFRVHDETGIDTLIGRFHTSGDRDVTHNEASLFQTAVSKFGMSHGRNLLSKQAYQSGVASKINGYENPYCRTWTYHSQYGRVSDLIRPFAIKASDDSTEITDVGTLQSDWWKYGRRAGSAARLQSNSSLNRNGFVNITPAVGNEVQKSIDVKKCMFSIENLAWKNQSPIGSNQSSTEGGNVKSYYGALSPEQIGPNGGRIMWFPPYDLKFNEQVNVNWGHTEFIGRGEKIYTYTNTERTGTLSFTLLVDHPSVLEFWKKNGKSGDVNNDEQTLLRFFAGCETLTINNKNTNVNDSKINSLIPQYDTIPFEDGGNEEIVFYVFFPNNYSGIDDVITKPWDTSHINNVLSYLTTEYEVKSTGSSKGTIYEGYDYQYRVDKELLSEKLLPDNYKDKTGFSLNSSLTAVQANASFKSATNTIKDIHTKLQSEIAKKGNKITSITVTGYASNHGYDEKNNMLSAHRAQMISRWIASELKGLFGFNSNLMTVSVGGTINVDSVDKDNVSGESAKRARCVKVAINILKGDNTKKLENGTLDISEENETQISEKHDEKKKTKVSELTKAEKRALRRKVRKMSDEDKIDAANVVLEERGKAIQNEINKKDSTLLLENFNTLLSRNAKIASASQLQLDSSKPKQKRWDEESQYFEMLEANDSFTYSRLIDKIKYFNPAFHSITPEGFNARLGFLHQCTRQGSTIGAADGRVQRSAGNMAFGRPPICVLRIGDFFHTKIAIQSLTIDYENPQWDMNPEGIGMQPMLAKVSMNIVYLGGSDITAPISRLQNAVSFNFYANQSIYDDRADIGAYSNNKPIIQGKPWLPNYEMADHGGSILTESVKNE